MTPSGHAMIAGVVGSPVAQSLSPLIHNAWLAAAGIDAFYIPVALSLDGFERFIAGVRGGPLRGLNVTIPFKAQALALADEADEAAMAAGAANLLLFEPDDRIVARNTDGVGLIAALTDQAPELDLARAPAVVIGAGGAGQGAVTALLRAGAPQVRVVNRTKSHAEALASRFGARMRGYGLAELAVAFADAGLIVNATSAGMNGQHTIDLPLERAPETVVFMDMVYRPLRPALLAQAAARGLRTVDGLAMLIGQARPSFQALFNQATPSDVDVRALALRTLGQEG